MKYRKMYWWTYLHGRNRESEVENGFVDMGEGKAEGWMDWEVALMWRHYHG